MSISRPTAYKSTSNVISIHVAYPITETRLISVLTTRKWQRALRNGKYLNKSGSRTSRSRCCCPCRGSNSKNASISEIVWMSTRTPYTPPNVLPALNCRRASRSRLSHGLVKAPSIDYAGTVFVGNQASGKEEGKAEKIWLWFHIFIAQEDFQIFNGWKLGEDVSLNSASRSRNIFCLHGLKTLHPGYVPSIVLGHLI